MAKIHSQKLMNADHRNNDDDDDDEDVNDYKEDLTEEDSDYNDEDYLNQQAPNKLILSDKSTRRTITKIGRKSSFENKICWSAVLIGIIALLITVPYIIIPLAKNSEVYACDNATFIIEEINKLREQFSSQPDDTWATFASGLLRLFANEPTEPAAFLLFHEDDNTIKCLVKRLSDFAAKCYNGNATVFSLNGVHLNDEIFLQDSGELIKQYKSEIVDKKVMIIYGLNDVPANVAQELHYFCDVYQPLVDNAVYFFILKKEITSVKSSKLIENVSKELKSLWKNLEYNKLDPLIARITTNVLPVHTENNIGWCL